jgi:hypothetical protein
MWHVIIRIIYGQMVMRLKSSVKLLSAIALISTLSLMSGVPIVQTATALPSRQPAEMLKRQNAGELPRSLNSRVRRDISLREGIPAQQLRVIRAERRTWNNGCLGLPNAGEDCTRGTVPGWLVEVERNSDRWLYRTDARGRQVRLERTTRSAQVPKPIVDAVLNDIAGRSDGPQTSLQIVSAEQRTWNDGCLGLAKPGVLCTQALVPGWRIRVEGKTQRWIYRTNQTGSVVKLERETTAKNEGSIKPIQLSDQDLPEALKKGVLFRAITSGGFTGQTSERLLLADGQVLDQRVNVNGTATPVRKWRISQQRLQDFQTLLKQERFERFDHLSYPAKSGSADFQTVTLSSPSGTVQYSDSVQSQLPRSLQTIIQAWTTLK